MKSLDEFADTQKEVVRMSEKDGMELILSILVSILTAVFVVKFMR